MRAAATVYELLLGLALLFSPWSSLWQDNWFLWASGGLAPWLQSGAVRGAVSGLGAAYVLAALAKLLKVDLLGDEGAEPPPAQP